MSSSNPTQSLNRTQYAGVFWKVLTFLLAGTVGCILGILVTNIADPKLVLVDEGIKFKSINQGLLPNGDYKMLQEIRLRLINRSIAAGRLETVCVVPENIPKKMVTIKTIHYDKRRIWFLQEKEIVARHEVVFHNSTKDFTPKSDQPVFSFYFYDNRGNPIDGIGDLKIKLSHEWSLRNKEGNILFQQPASENRP